MRRVTFKEKELQEILSKTCYLIILYFITSQVKNKVRPISHTWAKFTSQKNRDYIEAEVMAKIKRFQRRHPQ